MSSANATADDVQKPYQCETCERKFARLEHLQRHVRTHTKHKPFVCFCGRSFTRNDLLKRHKQRTHLGPTFSVQPGGDEVLGAASSSSRDNTNSTNNFSNEVTPGGLVAEPNMSFDPVHDFAAFMESIGLAPDWVALDLFNFEPVNQLTVSNIEEETQERERSPSTRQDRSNVPVYRYGPLPNTVSAEPATAATESHFQWKLTEKQWQNLVDRVTAHESIRDFILPSRNAMSRYFQSCADQFHKHYPMLHLPTFCPEKLPLCLTLAIVAVGARYRLESKIARPLYNAAMTLALEQNKSDKNTRLTSDHASSMIQTLVLLMGYGAWDWDSGLCDSALDLQSVLSGYIRGSLREAPSPNNGESRWESWVRVEMHRRTILIAYAYLVVQSMAYDLPPVVLFNPLEKIELPCNSDEWEAHNEQEWYESIGRSGTTTVRAVDALHYLLGGTDTFVYLSEIGSFIMLQALIQRIYLSRQLHAASSAALPPADLDNLQRALARWKNVCQLGSNSILDPRSSENPIPWTSIAFLSFAFARLHVDLGPFRNLHTRDPQTIAITLLSTPIPECSQEIIPALLHAAHALSVPVLMGIDFVARNQTLFWTCEQALCGLESAVFLWRWLQSAGEALHWHNLNADEKGIISWVLSSVSEALQSIDASDFGLKESIVLSELTYPQLGLLVLKIWARIFSSPTAWPLTNEIGTSLQLLAGMVEAA